MQLLKGKTAIITGATRGIGKGVALKLAEHGADVAFTYISSSEKALALENELKAFGVKAKGYKSDASLMKDAEELIKNVLENFESIDVLVNNAGITKDNLLMRMSKEDFDRVLEVNLKSIFNMTKAVQRTMLKQRSGSIVNMTSVVGVKGNAGQSNYAASKAGTIGMSKSLSIEYAKKNITINCVSPGFIVSDMTNSIPEKIKSILLSKIPMGKMGSGDDVSNCVAFLSSDEASYITGETIHVNGGMYMA